MHALLPVGLPCGTLQQQHCAPPGCVVRLGVCERVLLAPRCCLLVGCMCASTHTRRALTTSLTTTLTRWLPPGGLPTCVLTHTHHQVDHLLDQVTACLHDVGVVPRAPRQLINVVLRAGVGVVKSDSVVECNLAVLVGWLVDL